MDRKCHAPRTMDALFAALAQMGEHSKVIGGGSDLIIHLHSGRVQPDALLYAGGVPALRAIRRTARGVEIGAAATMAQIARDPLLTGALGAVADAAADVGSAQIRNNATIGGNVANASPAGDLIPPLFLLGALVEIAAPDGLQTLPIDQVVLGPSRTCLRHNQIISGVILPAPPQPGYRSAFHKLGFRRAVTISRIGLAVGAVVDDAGVITHADVFAGAISLTPLRVKQAEALLRGAPLDQLPDAEVGAALAALIHEVTPEEFDRDYKIGAAPGVAADALARLQCSFQKD